MNFNSTASRLYRFFTPAPGAQLFCVCAACGAARLLEINHVEYKFALSRECVSVLKFSFILTPVKIYDAAVFSEYADAMSFTINKTLRNGAIYFNALKSSILFPIY